ncbi:MAG TPA: ATP synthase F1 subunit gamma [Candidatus Paceibacterota bacterium]|nr:ATP synthase F1 subunit gamma [Verrucomicrobiota bacterium]HSA12950.1 ATP synthase F1 subunit gamma [Candidatus Paceibacterota bacterium]
MPSTRDIRRRIKSVKSTAQITKAMQMVASSKMLKAQQGAVNFRPFAAMGGELMGYLTQDTSDYRHPLMETREVRKRAVILVGTDKGLCGALNSNLFREASKCETATTQFIAVGKKAAQFVARTRRKLIAEFTYHDTPTYGECQTISKFAQNLFLKGEADVVDVLYTRFINTLQQRPDARTLLPMRTAESLLSEARGEAEPPSAERPRFNFLFEPDPVTVMDRLVLYFLDFRVAQLLLEAKASEHSARMVAMKNATDNANQLVKQLTLDYNKMRQASITKELLEIASAAMALG